MVAPKDNKTTSPSDYNEQLEQWAWEQGKERHDKRRYQTKVDSKTGELIVDPDKLRSADPSRNEPEWKIIEQAHPKVVEAWDAFVEEGREKMAKKGPPVRGFREIMDLPADLVAYIGLSMLMEGVASQLEHQMLLQKLGQRTEHMAFDQWLQAQDRDLARQLWQRSIETFNTYDKRFMSVRAIAEQRGYSRTEWTRTTQVYVGTLIYNIVMEKAGVFVDFTEYKKLTNKKTGKQYIRQRELVTLTDEAMLEIRDFNERAQWMQPMFPPMTVKPIPWGKGMNAPYSDPHLSDLCRFVRRAGLPQQRRIDQAIAEGKMDTVIEAVNTVQEVPLRLNTYIVDAIDWCWSNNLTPGKFPDSQEVPPPEVSNDNEEDPQVVKLAKYAERQRIKLNHGCRSSVATMASMLATIFMLKDREFFLPHSLDFRSRIYPIPSFNHYGADYQKALFYSARPKRIGAVGAQWLYVHIANCADFKDEDGVKLTKKSINDRIAWVQDNWDMLLSVGEQFEATFDIWSKADKPFSFIAACRELIGLHKYGYDHKCGLFVAADGTNSGMQHFSAALRHRQNGMMVNLTEADPNTPPQDIYQFIADKVTEQVEWDAKSVDPAEAGPAKLWLTFCDNRIDRSVVKRGVMTFGYNSNAYGMTDQIMDDLMKPLFVQSMKDKTPHPFAVDDDLNGFRAAKYLAHIMFGIIRKNLEAASLGMDFFKGCVNATSTAGKHIAWESPLGFPFAQNYRHYDVDRIKPSMYTRGIKRRKQVSVMRDDRDNTARVQRADSENGISANAIHMMDATHMMMTIVQLKYDGVEDMMMLHDSFSVMPADMEVLWSAVRETFVTLYRDYDLYADVHSQVSQLLEAEKIMLEEEIYQLERELWEVDITPKEEAAIEKLLADRQKQLAMLTLPDPPEPGDLDLEEVLRSYNCFH